MATMGIRRAGLCSSLHTGFREYPFHELRCIGPKALFLIGKSINVSWQTTALVAH